MGEGMWGSWQPAGRSSLGKQGRAGQWSAWATLPTMALSPQLVSPPSQAQRERLRMLAAGRRLWGIGWGWNPNSPERRTCRERDTREGGRLPLNRQPESAGSWGGTQGMILLQPPSQNRCSPQQTQPRFEAPHPVSYDRGACSDQERRLSASPDRTDRPLGHWTS